MNEQFNKAIEEASKWLNWKIGEELSAINEYNKHSLAVQNVLNIWSIDLHSEKYQISSALLKLQLKDKMTDKQFSRLNDYLDEFYKKQQKQIDELDKELGEIRKENYKEKLEKINEIYKGKSTDVN